MKTNAYFLCDFETTGLDIETLQPIELGGIFLDENFEERKDMMPSRIDTLIYDLDQDDWETPSEKAAFAVHKISVGEVIQDGVSPVKVCSRLFNAVSFLKTDIGVDRVILMSDNIQFEFGIMKKLFKSTGIEFPFHYCGWDTSILLEGLYPDIGDPKDVPHRALPDALLVWEHLKKAVARCRQ